GYREGQQAAGGQEKMAYPAGAASWIEKTLKKNIPHEQVYRPAEIWKKIATQHKLPGTAPVHSGGRALEPHRISVGNPEYCEDGSEKVSNEGGIKILKVA